jgi:hypothetical protein
MQDNYTDLEPSKDFDRFMAGYIECLLWSSHDQTEDGQEIRFDDYDRSDFAPEALASIREDCEAFWKENRSLILGEPDAPSLERAGYDFWLTRAGHGAGFWDGDWPLNGDRLTEASKAFWSFDPYLGDDGKIYFSG